MIKRKLLNKLRLHLPKKEMTIIAGPRQAGKTTLMKILIGELTRKGENCVYYNLDIEKDKKHFDTQQTFMKAVQLQMGCNKGFVFIDEIQRKTDAGKYIKGIYDSGFPHKIILSGSGSIELKEHIHESLAGRKLLFELLPVNFEEFLNFKTDYKYEDNLGAFADVFTEEAESYLYEYLNFGGYPRVITSESKDEKYSIIEDLYKSYIERDIANLISNGGIESFSILIKLLAGQTGKLLNLTKLAGFAGISYQTLKNYIWYAEKTYITNLIKPFHRNYTKELTKAPVVYFNDTGFINFATDNFGSVHRHEDLSFLFQNFIYGILDDKTRHQSTNINFWRTTDKAEVDFIINGVRTLIPVEVKFSKLQKPAEGKSLRSFIEKYNPEKAIIMNLTLNAERKVNKTRIVYLTPFRLMNRKLGNI